MTKKGSIDRDFGKRGSPSVSIPVGYTEDCPNCGTLGRLRVEAGSRIPKSGEGAPRRMVCDFCGWEMVSNLHGPDNIDPSPWNRPFEQF